MKIKLGISSCPNDTFIFDALVNHKIDTEGFEFDVLIADVEELNKRAFKNELDMIKVSYQAYTKLYDSYLIMNAGSALGRNCGPLLIAKKNSELSNNSLVAIPGQNTTAHALFKRFFPDVENKYEMLFSEIEDAVNGEDVDAGLIIHESRFTYEKKGLVKLFDLGELWEEKCQLPIPLGGIIANRRLQPEVIKKLNALLRESVEFAFNNPEEPMEYMREYAAEMEDEVMKQHVELYVNDFSVDLGDEGKQAVKFLLSSAIPEDIEIFVDEFIS